MNQSTKSERRELKRLKLKAYFQMAFHDKFTYIYFAGFVFLFILITLIIHYALHRLVLDSFSVAGALLFVVIVATLLVKAGFLTPYLARRHKKRMELIQYKKSQLNKISDMSRRNYERRKLELMEETQKKYLDQQPTQPVRNNFIWYVLLFVVVICLIVAIVLLYA
ncbi:DUF3899 domain-containing protein [[Mycoplasma] testudinis]|uniref:DUF3899 domain-containing protein n=1 Tax=[Mycoplasma] testudinis TaxID=33924 RepID=UPI00048A3231|nr:DUF3899 domain-containing protein [[Mycoplasma] testudinis]